MSVASHLRIELQEYDYRIRTFVPGYDTMLAVVAGALHVIAARAPMVVDLGIGTGALAHACLQARPDLRLVGLDLDAGMLDAARARLNRRDATLMQADFVERPLPPAEAFVACISLHHIREPAVKQAFYRRVYAALLPGGLLLSADCFPAAHPALAQRQREAWLAHLERTYTRQESEAYLESWAHDDVYFPLESELEWLREAGLRTELVWRQDGFAVVAGMRA